MPIYDTYSRRAKDAEGTADPLVYELPLPVREQANHIVRRLVEGTALVLAWHGANAWAEVSSSIAEQLGLARLPPVPNVNNTWEVVFGHFIRSAATPSALDAIEVSLQWSAAQRRIDKKLIETTIAELNERFRMGAVGFRLEGARFLRLDSEFQHREVTLPALYLLRGEAFRGPESEFLLAHEHYRHGRLKEAANEALKAYESTMKAIIGARGWAVKPKATASTLVETIMANQLLPSFAGGGFTGMASGLKEVVQTIRNQTSGHGQGVDIKHVNPELIAYALHVTAANIILLVEAHKAMP